MIKNRILGQPSQKLSIYSENGLYLAHRYSITESGKLVKFTFEVIIIFHSHKPIRLVFKCSLNPQKVC